MDSASNWLLNAAEVGGQSNMKEVAVSLGITDDSGRSYAQEFDDAIPSLSYETRFYGLVGATLVGLVCNILGTWWLSTGDLQMFAIYYAVGSVISIAGTCFLFGPCSQLRSMFAPIRRAATIVYLLSIFATVFVAVEVGQVIPTVFCLVVQFAAYVYYCASYLPGGRACLRACIGSICKADV